MLTNLTLAQVTSATGVDLETWAKDVVSLEKKAKTAADEFTGSMFDAGLVVYGVKRHHRVLQDEKHVGSTTPWAATWKRLTGTEKPVARATTMALAIEAYVVEGGHLTEPELRACPVDSAETAVGIYKDVGSQLTHEAVGQAATLLKGYSGPKTDKERKKIITELKALRKSLKPAEPMDADTARELVQGVLKANPDFVRIVATELVASLRYLPEENREVNLHGVWAQFQLADSVWPPELVEKWLDTSAEPTTPPAAPAPASSTTAKAPEPAPAPVDAWIQNHVPPSVNDEGRRKLHDIATAYLAELGELPESLVELANWKKNRKAAEVPA